ncbi:hypothetical protein [Limnoglobus roseus]|nr:hypothetical protein [Limnoglobus roseus]
MTASRPCGIEDNRIPLRPVAKFFSHVRWNADLSPPNSVSVRP